MICIKNNLIPFKGYKAINIFGIVFTKEKLTKEEKNHERIHSRQMFDIGLLTLTVLVVLDILFNFSNWLFLISIPSFYIWYCIEYLIIRFFHKKQKDAYRDISFEEEAHLNDNNLSYIEEERIPFRWMNYIKIKSLKK